MTCLGCLGRAATAICPTLAAKKKSRNPSPRKASPTRGFSPSRRQLPLKTEPLTTPKRRTISHEGTVLNVDPEPAQESSSSKMHLIVLGDNQAVIKIVQKGRAPALRHLHRTHRVNLDWICETCQCEHIEL
eukprot:5780884-Pyramimonas_sp.AAC.1